MDGWRGTPLGHLSSMTGRGAEACLPSREHSHAGLHMADGEFFTLAAWQLKWRVPRQSPLGGLGEW